MKRSTRCAASSIVVFLLAMTMLGSSGVSAQSSDSSTPVSESASPESSPEELGLVDDETYVSPQFDHEVTWGNDWEADPASMESNEDDQLDRLSIVSNIARFQVFYVTAGEETTEEYAERLIGFRTDIYPDLEVIDQNVGDEIVSIFYSYEESGDLVVGVIEVSFVDRGDNFQVVELISYPEDTEDAWDEMDAQVEIDGNAPFQVFTEFPPLDGAE